MAVSSPIVASEIEAQAIQGRIVDAATSIAIAEVYVEATRDGQVLGRATSDRDGSFVIYLKSPGSYQLHSSRLGYASVESEVVEVGGRTLVEIVLQMSRTPLEVPGIIVEVRRRDPRSDATYEGLYARRSTALPVGSERIVVQGDFQMEASTTVRDVMRWFSPPRGCVVYYVDGLRRNGFMWGILDMSVSMLEGVEYYKNSIWAPIGFEPGWGCSVVAVWRTRVGR